MTTTAEKFARDTATHRLEIAHDEGLYRHLKLRAHDEHGRPRSTCWFDVIAVPGTLTFVGDYEAVVLRRSADMFEFVRSSTYRGAPDLSYWAEKVASGGERSVREYSEDVFRRVVRERVADDIRQGDAPRGIGRAVRTLLDSWEYDTTSEAGARAALDAFEYEGYTLGDTWEWELTDYTHAFGWACHAITLAVRLYDEAKAGQGGDDRFAGPGWEIYSSWLLRHCDMCSAVGATTPAVWVGYADRETGHACGVHLDDLTTLTRSLADPGWAADGAPDLRRHATGGRR